MYPDDNYTKIQFETGEVAWINCITKERLGLIFADLSSGFRLKNKLPKYKILSTPKLNKCINLTI
jgi:hypothetical protein